MTLKGKSIIIFLVMLAATVFSFRLFSNFNWLHNSIITNLFTSGQILEAENRIYGSLRGEPYDIETAKRVIKDVTRDMMLIKEDVLTKDEFHNLAGIRLSFIRIERILMSDRPPVEIELRQIHRELLKIGESIREFREAFRPRMEREMASKGKVLTSIYFLIGLSLLFLFAGLYRYFIGPILYLGSQVEAVKDGKIKNIKVYKAKDEIGRLSDFTSQTLNELNKSNETLSRQLEIQNATSRILKAAQKPADVDSFLKSVLDIVLSLRGLNVMDMGAILLADEANPDILVLKAYRNFGEFHIKTCTRGVAFGRCICGKAAQEGKIIYKSCIDGDHEIQYEGMAPHGHYCAPIKQGGRVLGVINLYLEENYVPAEMDKEFLENISMIIADTLEIKKLAEMEHLIITAIEESGEGVIIANRDGGIEYMNPAVEVITGYTEEELRSINIFANMRCWGIGEDVARDVTNGNIWSASLKSKKKDGKDYYELLSVIPVKNEKGELIKFVSISRDLTKERSLEDQLRQSQKMEVVGRFAGGIAHDFNNILTAIMGYGNLIMEDMRGDDPLRDYVREVLSSTERAANLTRSLLAFSRRQPIALRPVNLNEVIKGVEKLLLRLISADIELKTTLSEKDMTVMADSGQLEQMLLNLATNARDAMPEGGVLTIETSQIDIDEEYVKSHLFAKPGTYALITVTDTGTGMDAETRERVFEPFFTTKGVGKGTGLGMSIVYGIIKQHDGNINVYSEPGMGTAFKIFLPLVKTGPEEMQPVEETSRPVRGTETVLLAEDDASVRRLIKEFLEKNGYTVVEAVDGEEAVMVFREKGEKIDILLFDVMMPKKNGIEAYEEIIKIRPEIKPLFMSGYAEEVLHRKGLTEKGLDLLSKPVSPNNILKSIREALDR